jgi:hypothetical protein
MISSLLQLTGCKHEFHLQCILEWYGTNSNMHLTTFSRLLFCCALYLYSSGTHMLMNQMVIIIMKYSYLLLDSYGNWQ